MRPEAQNPAGGEVVFSFALFFLPGPVAGRRDARERLVVLELLQQDFDRFVQLLVDPGGFLDRVVVDLDIRV